MSGVVDGAATKFNGILDGHVITVATVQDTIGKGGARADGEPLSLQAGTVTVDVEESRSLSII